MLFRSANEHVHGLGLFPHLFGFLPLGESLVGFVRVWGAVGQGMYVAPGLSGLIAPQVDAAAACAIRFPMWARKPPPRNASLSVVNWRKMVDFRSRL